MGEFGLLALLGQSAINFGGTGRRTGDTIRPLERTMSKTFVEEMDSLISLHRKVAGLNSALAKRYPVAVVLDEQFQIYDISPDQEHYKFRKTAPIPMPIPIGIRAAFQLEDYGGRIACVVTPEVFDSPAGYVTILHEFVHCYQYETCEQDLKMKLDIARKAQEVGDFMWEIEHPFPYTSKDFIRSYAQFLKAIDEGHAQKIHHSRKELRDYLGVHDYEYMVWQEWKEGFARWIENRVKRQLGMPENKGGVEPPFTRVLFYTGGEAYIELLVKKKPTLAEDLPGLFDAMFTPGLDL